MSSPSSNRSTIACVGFRSPRELIGRRRSRVDLDGSNLVGFVEPGIEANHAPVRPSFDTTSESTRTPRITSCPSDLSISEERRSTSRLTPSL